MFSLKNHLFSHFPLNRLNKINNKKTIALNVKIQKQSNLLLTIPRALSANSPTSAPVTKQKIPNNANHAKKIIVYDVPLIYETKSEEKYDLILLANCNKTLQKKRVLMRDKISNALFDNIIKSQLSFDEKMKFKPKVFNTGNFKQYKYLLFDTIDKNEF